MVAWMRIMSYNKESLLAIPGHVVEWFALPNELLTQYVLAPSPDLKDFYENDETRDTP